MKLALLSLWRRMLVWGWSRWSLLLMQNLCGFHRFRGAWFRTRHGKCMKRGVHSWIRRLRGLLSFGGGFRLRGLFLLPFRFGGEFLGDWTWRRISLMSSRVRAWTWHRIYRSRMSLISRVRAWIWCRMFRGNIHRSRMSLMSKMRAWIRRRMFRGNIYRVPSFLSFLFGGGDGTRSRMSLMTRVRVWIRLGRRVCLFNYKRMTIMTKVQKVSKLRADIINCIKYPVVSLCRLKLSGWMRISARRVQEERKGLTSGRTTAQLDSECEHLLRLVCQSSIQGDGEDRQTISCLCESLPVDVDSWHSSF